MSYTLILQCGCSVRVTARAFPGSSVVRRIEMRGPACRDRRHHQGGRVWLWQLRPEPPSADVAAAGLLS